MAGLHLRPANGVAEVGVAAVDRSHPTQSCPHRTRRRTMLASWRSRPTILIWMTLSWASRRRRTGAATSGRAAGRRARTRAQCVLRLAIATNQVVRRTVVLPRRDAARRLELGDERLLYSLTQLEKALSKNRPPKGPIKHGRPVLGTGEIKTHTSPRRSRTDQWRPPRRTRHRMGRTDSRIRRSERRAAVDD